MLYKNIWGVFCLKTSHTHTHTHWGHQRFTLHLVKITFYHPFKQCCSFEFSIHLKCSETTVLNIDNNTKCILSIKSSYPKDYRRIMWHWRLE